MASTAAEAIAAKHNAGVTPGVGGNSVKPAKQFAQEQLSSVIERIEKLEEEKKTFADDIADVYKEAKGNGFDTKALRTIIRERQKPKDKELEAVIETYRFALGMLD